MNLGKNKKAIKGGHFLEGKTVNNFNVKRYIGGSKYSCKCKCGKSFITTTKSIVNKKRQSCGCARIKDYIGKRFGKLKVIKRIVAKGRCKSVSLVCVCECNRKTIFSVSTLKKGKRIACEYCQPGRKGVPSWKNKNINKENLVWLSLYSLHKWRAKRCKHEFKLTLPQSKKIYKKNCYYCGKKPSGKYKKYGIILYYSGLDRVDSNKNYTKNNVVPCCSKCNWLKNDFEMNEFLKMAENVYHNRSLPEINKTIEETIEYVI